MWIPLILRPRRHVRWWCRCNTDTSSPYGSKRGAWVPLLPRRELTLAVTSRSGDEWSARLHPGYTDTSSPYARVIEDALPRGVGLLMTAGLIVVAGYVARWRMTVIVRLVSHSWPPRGGDGWHGCGPLPRAWPLLQAAATGYALQQPSYGVPVDPNSPPAGIPPLLWLLIFLLGGQAAFAALVSSVAAGCPVSSVRSAGGGVHVSAALPPTRSRVPRSTESCRTTRRLAQARWKTTSIGAPTFC